MMKKSLVTVLVASLSCVSIHAQAAINGSFDSVTIGLTDTGHGWICEETNPYVVPPGTLVVYVGGPAGGGGTLDAEHNIDWGHSRTDVSNLGLCGGNPNTGWVILDWFTFPMYVYYKAPGGALTPLGNKQSCSFPGC